MNTIGTRSEARGQEAGDAGPAFTRLRAMVMLAGSIRRNRLPRLVGRSVLDLPLAGGVTLLDVWRRRIDEVGGHCVATGGALPVRILVGPEDPVPSIQGRDGELAMRVERDESQYRGTAGVLRDLCREYSADDHVLVGNASQCPDEGLLAHLLGHAMQEDGVTLLAGDRGAPSGLMLIRCGALRLVPEVGYIDLKEQALSRIAETSGVRVLEGQGKVSRPIRRARDYIDVVGSWHRSGSLVGVSAASPFEERWKPAFTLVEDGARVGEGARLYDSVVLAGGVVESGCELVRSVVGPGGVAHRKGLLIDQLILGLGDTRPGEPARSDR